MNHLFANRNEFREYLSKNHALEEGQWLIFGKAGGPKTLSPNEALEEALCFGWIDGQIRKIDDFTYLKYFAKRRKKSIWSKRNRELSEELIQKGLMTQYGLDAILQAKKDNVWENELDVLSDAHIDSFLKQVEPNEKAYTNLMKMSKSVQKTYTGFYLSAKQEETKIKRLNQIIERLEKNLKPME
ncbi:MAG: YdeI/OmpD-associated family protein [Acholeplasmataceae bacterium]|nr:YdeI/OmpD-associated family protein [Acholeplasmataceae bacterium]